MGKQCVFITCPSNLPSFFTFDLISSGIAGIIDAHFERATKAQVDTRNRRGLE